MSGSQNLSHRIRGKGNLRRCRRESQAEADSPSSVKRPQPLMGFRSTMETGTRLHAEFLIQKRGQYLWFVTRHGKTHHPQLLGKWSWDVHFHAGNGPEFFDQLSC